jgi:hypothetical protein
MVKNMPVVRSHYYHSLIFIIINRDEVEEEVRDFYLPITKNLMRVNWNLQLLFFLLLICLIYHLFIFF